MDYLVTAIITTHHREAEIIERALKSVLQQTYKNIEVIIVNDTDIQKMAAWS
ncbi:MAG: glycosyltransferase family A protein [Hespellia sp.]|nr:glycosyltransferase family A protein [Hespellia sp.]